MTIEAAWLAAVYQGLQNYVPSHVDAPKRASVAVILRTNHPDPLSLAQSSTPHTINYDLNIEVLFMKRAMR